MRVIIAGSRDIVDAALVWAAVHASGIYPIAEVVSGGARGVDTLGEEWATYHCVPINRLEPDWLLYGKAAGPIRNKKMVANADAAIVIWDGQSRGSADLITQATKAKLKVFVYRMDDNSKSGYVHE